MVSSTLTHSSTTYCVIITLDASLTRNESEIAVPVIHHVEINWLFLGKAGESESFWIFPLATRILAFPKIQLANTSEIQCSDNKEIQHTCIVRQQKKEIIIFCYIFSYELSLLVIQCSVKRSILCIREYAVRRVESGSSAVVPVHNCKGIFCVALMDERQKKTRLEPKRESNSAASTVNISLLPSDWKNSNYSSSPKKLSSFFGGGRDLKALSLGQLLSTLCW